MCSAPDLRGRRIRGEGESVSPCLLDLTRAHYEQALRDEREREQQREPDQKDGLGRQQRAALAVSVALVVVGPLVDADAAVGARQRGLARRASAALARRVPQARVRAADDGRGVGGGAPVAGLQREVLEGRAPTRLGKAELMLPNQGKQSWWGALLSLHRPCDKPKVQPVSTNSKGSRVGTVGRSRVGAEPAVGAHIAASAPVGRRDLDVGRVTYTWGHTYVGCTRASDERAQEARVRAGMQAGGGAAAFAFCQKCVGGACGTHMR